MSLSQALNQFAQNLGRYQLSGPEQKSSNLMVVGSNPTGSTRSIRIRQPVCSFVWISGVVAERSNATVPKAAGAQAPGGSNPPYSANPA